MDRTLPAQPWKRKVGPHGPVTYCSNCVCIRTAHGLGLLLKGNCPVFPLPLLRRKRQPLRQGQLSTQHFPASLLQLWAPRWDLELHSQTETVARGPTQHPNPRDHMEAALRNSLGPEDPQHPMAVAKPTLQMRKLRLGGGKPQIQSRDWDQAPPAVWEACFWPLLALVVGVYPGEHPTPAEITSLSWVNTRKQGGQAVGRATFLIVWPADGHWHGWTANSCARKDIFQAQEEDRQALRRSLNEQLG